MERIKKIIRLMLGKSTAAGNLEHLAAAGSDSDITGVSIQVNDEIRDKKYMTVGSGCLISGRFVFERSSGYVTIGNNTFIGGGQFISIEGIEIGNDVMFSWGCTVADNDAHSLDWRKRMNDVRDWKKGVDEGKTGKYKNWEHVGRGKIVIKDKVWIGFNCIILKGVTIGEGAVIGAGSVVTKDIPAHCVAAGNPARVVKQLD